jgi:Family of unknown function (DUF6527)
MLWRDVLDWDHEYEEVDFGSVTVILCKPETAWTISGQDFETMTVTPSLDASAAGHWHGFITAGNIKGGNQLP